VERIKGGRGQEQDRRQGLDQAASYIAGESVGTAQEHRHAVLVGVLAGDMFVVGVLLAEAFGRQAGGAALVREVMVRAAHHEGQVAGLLSAGSGFESLAAHPSEQAV
jgi:hypothetical protein